MTKFSIESASINSKQWTFELQLSGSIEANASLEIRSEYGLLLQTLNKQGGADGERFSGILNSSLLSKLIESGSGLVLNLSTNTSDPHELLNTKDIKGPHLDLALVKSMYESISPVPTMPPRCVDLYTDFLQGKNTIIEYGSGGSTLLSQKNNIKNIISTESDFNWMLALIHKFNEAADKSRSQLHPIYINIGPTGPWGTPTSTSAIVNYAQYPVEPWQKARELRLQPEIALIDGRFRVACFLTSLLCAAPGAVLIFDDYNDRPQYHVIETIIKPIVRVDRQAVFITSDDFDKGAAHQLAMRYSTNPA